MQETWSSPWYMFQVFGILQMRSVEMNTEKMGFIPFLGDSRPDDFYFTVHEWNDDWSKILGTVLYCCTLSIL